MIILKTTIIITVTKTKTVENNHRGAIVSIYTYNGVERHARLNHIICMCERT